MYYKNKCICNSLWKRCFNASRRVCTYVSMFVFVSENSSGLSCYSVLFSLMLELLFVRRLLEVGGKGFI